MELILASTSPYRRALLERLGAPFRCVAPPVDEDAFKAKGLRPEELARTLAVAKADAVAQNHPDCTVVGGDQVAAIEGLILDKPGSVERAIAQLQLLTGRKHSLFTAIAVVAPSIRKSFIDVTTLRMRSLTLKEIERYVAADAPFDCAGSYKFESRGITLFDSIDSTDQSAITGIPLIALTSVLRELGFSIP